MKIAFCFPGQGSLEMGMGRDIAHAFPVAREVYRVGSEASGLDLERLCFETPLEDLVDTEVQQPALVRRAWRSSPRCASAASSPTSSLATRWESSPRWPLPARSAPVKPSASRERGLAMAEAARQRPGTMAAILGLEDEEVEKLCRKIVGVWPANYNCPGQIVISGEHEAVEECCAEAENLGARRAIQLKVSGAFHSPLVARAADRLRPALDKVRFTEPLAPFMSTVTAKVEPAQRLAALLVDQLTAPVRFTQAATELIRGGATTFVEVGPGNVLSGLVRRIDRGVKTISVNTVESLDRAQEALVGELRRVLLPRGQERARDGRLARDRPRDREGARPRRRVVVVSYRTGNEEAEALAAEIGGRAIQSDVSDPDSARLLVEEAGDLDVLVNNAGVTRDGLLVRMSDEDWQTVIDTNLASCFYTSRAAVRGMMKKRAGRS